MLARRLHPSDEQTGSDPPYFLKSRVFGKLPDDVLVNR
jgi:hypothetical protein